MRQLGGFHVKRRSNQVKCRMECAEDSKVHQAPTEPIPKQATTSCMRHSTEPLEQLTIIQQFSYPTYGISPNSKPQIQLISLEHSLAAPCQGYIDGHAPILFVRKWCTWEAVTHCKPSHNGWQIDWDLEYRSHNSQFDRHIDPKISWMVEDARIEFWLLIQPYRTFYSQLG